MVYPVLAGCSIGKEIGMRDAPFLKDVFPCLQMEIGVLITQFEDGKK